MTDRYPEPSPESGPAQPAGPGGWSPASGWPGSSGKSGPAGAHRGGGPAGPGGPLPPPAAAGLPAPASWPRRTWLAVAGAALMAVLVVALGAGLFGGWMATRYQDGATPLAAGTDTRPAAQLDRSSLAAVVGELQPSVVSIKTDAGEGSGVVLDEDGHVLTNEHVVAATSGDAVTVTFSDGDTAEATIVGGDPRSDLAVVQVEGDAAVTPAAFGDSDATAVGDSVLALGSPLGLEGSVTSGIVSAKNRTIQAGAPEPGQPGESPQAPATSISGMIQTDAPINPGNSGGALANLDGEVIGINSAIATAGGSSGNIGVGFAIPSQTALQVAEELIAGEQPAHPYLGVSVADADGEGGALVQQVAPGGPAEAAELRTGDVIVGLGNEPVRSADDLVSAVQRSKVGEKLQLTVHRDGADQQVTVTTGEAPAT